MIPLWVWPALCVVALLALSEYECWQINRTRDNMRDIEAERRARENSYPLGNAERWYGLEDETKDVSA